MLFGRAVKTRARLSRALFQVPVWAASARMSTSKPTRPETAPGLAREGRIKADLAAARSASAPTASHSIVKATVVCVDSPYSGAIVHEEPYLTAIETGAVVARAADAQREWAQLPLAARASAVEALVARVSASRASVAADISSHMGKPFSQALGEVDGMLTRARAFADIAPAALAERVVEDGLAPSAGGLASARSGAHPPPPRSAYADAAQSTDKLRFRRALTREPVGVVALVSPWNYPLMTTANGLLPSLLSGNGVVIKPSPRTPTSAHWWARAAEETGLFPPGLIASALCGHDDFAAAVLAAPKLGRLTATGSVETGRALYAAAAAASGTAGAPRFLGVGLELGGKDAMYVAADADVEAAAVAAVDGSCYNAGQSCCAVERVFVHESVYERFLEKAASEMQGYVLGDPAAESTTMGPLALTSALPRLEAHVADALARGARALVGLGGPLDGAGARPRAAVGARARFFSPTLLADCPPDALAMQAENFGPLLAVWPVRSDEEATALANSTPFGLTASVWTRSPARALALAARLDAGTVFANRCDYVDPYLHWGGGWGLSGLGSGVGEEGFMAVTRAKATHFKFAAPVEGEKHE